MSAVNLWLINLRYDRRDWRAKSRTAPQNQGSVHRQLNVILNWSGERCLRARFQLGIIDQA